MYVKIGKNMDSPDKKAKRLLLEQTCENCKYYLTLDPKCKAVSNFYESPLPCPPDGCESFEQRDKIIWSPFIPIRVGQETFKYSWDKVKKHKPLYRRKKIK